MLSERIIQTLTFFDAQDLPLTAMEIERYLIAEKTQLKNRLDEQYELKEIDTAPSPVHLDTIMVQLEALLQDQKISEDKVFYCRGGKESIISLRKNNYKKCLRRKK